MSPNYSGKKYCVFHVGIKPLTIEHLVDSTEAREKQTNKQTKQKNEENISSCLTDCYSNYAGLGSISVCWALDTGTCMNHWYEVSQVIHLTPQANTGNCFS